MKKEIEARSERRERIIYSQTSGLWGEHSERENSLNKVGVSQQKGK